MKNLLIVTDINFWRGGAGHRARLSSMILFLKDKLNVTVVYGGTFQQQDSAMLMY